MSITEILSLLPLLTKTYFSVATTELGLAPPTAGIPSISSPTRTPVFIFATTFGCVIFEISIVQTDKDSGTLGSPSPGISIVSFFIPLRASSELYAKGGNASAVSFKLL